MAKETKDKVILGLVGETGSGKDSFCEFAAKNAACFRFSDPLKDILRIFFDDKDIKKEDLQWLGIILRKKFGSDILAKAIIRKSINIKGKIIIFNGIRYWSDFREIKNLGGKIIYITAKSRTRWQRIKERREKKDDSFPYSNFLRLERAETEIFIPKIGKKADFKIENNGSKEEFKEKSLKLISKIII